jgi:hypothetical protein
MLAHPNGVGSLCDREGWRGKDAPHRVGVSAGQNLRHSCSPTLSAYSPRPRGLLAARPARHEVASRERSVRTIPVSPTELDQRRDLASLDHFLHSLPALGHAVFFHQAGAC